MKLYVPYFLGYKLGWEVVWKKLGGYGIGMWDEYRFDSPQESSKRETSKSDSLSLCINFWYFLYTSYRSGWASIMSDNSHVYVCFKGSFIFGSVIISSNYSNE